jgi:transposase
MTKRRTFSSQFKAQIALQALREHRSQASLCREHNLGADLISRWRQQLVERAHELFATPVSHSAEQERIAQLERLVGQLTFELGAAKKLSALLSSRSTRNGR